MASIKPKGRGKWMVRVFLGRDNETGKVEFLSRVIRGKKETAEQYARDRERERDLLGANAMRAPSLEVDGLLADLLADYKSPMHKAGTCILQRRNKPGKANFSKEYS